MTCRKGIVELDTDLGLLSEARLDTGALSLYTFLLAELSIAQPEPMAEDRRLVGPAETATEPLAAQQAA